MKLTMLIAFTTAGRSCDIKKIRHESHGGTNEIIFTIVQLTKTRKTGLQPVQIKLSTFTKNEKLDVVQCILVYIDKTLSLRSSDSS